MAHRPHEVFILEIMGAHHLVSFAAVDGGVGRGPPFQPPRESTIIFPVGVFVPEIIAVDGGALREPHFQPPHLLAAAATIFPIGVFVPSLPIPHGAAPSSLNSQNMFNGRPHTYRHQNNNQDLTRRERSDGGLSEAVIAKSLKTRSCDEAASNYDEDQKICTICQDDLCQEKQTIGVLKCRHEYHASCIKKWLQQKNICPLCKSTAL